MVVRTLISEEIMVQSAAWLFNYCKVGLTRVQQRDDPEKAGDGGGTTQSRRKPTSCKHINTTLPSTHFY